MSARSAVPRLYAALLRALLPRSVWARDGADIEGTFAELWADPARSRFRLAANAFGRIPALVAAEWLDRARSVLPGAATLSPRQGVRALLRAPAFTWSSVALLGLGVGAVTTIFTLVDHVILRPLPYPHPERLVVVENGSHSGPDWRSFRDLRSFDALAAQASDEANLTGEGEPLRLDELRVTERYFELFGATAQVGRLLNPADYGSGGSGGDVGGGDVAVLSAGAWARLFGRDPGVVGRTIRVDDAPVVVVGVAADDFVPPMSVRWGTPDLWRPETLLDPKYQTADYQALSVVARLAPGASVAEAARETRALADRRAALDPEHYRGPDGRIAPLPIRSLHDATVVDVREGLGLLLGAVGLLLLVACANLAHLFLARTLGRSRELAVRRALGAPGSALAGQLLMESLLIAACGTALGGALATLGVRAVLALSPTPLPGASAIRVDARVLLFAAAVASGTALLFGLLPALRLAARQPGDALRGAGRGVTGGRGARAARTTLVVAEVALSLVLVSQAGLLLESFARLRAQPLGFRVDGVWTLPIRLPEQREPAETLRRLEVVRAELASVPGVRAATYGLSVPMQFVGGSHCCWSTRIDVGGGGAGARVSLHPVAADWFTVFDSRVLAGRIWRPDEIAGQPTPAVINEALALALFGSADAAVGRTVQLRSLTMRAVGVVATDRHYGPDAPQGPAAYVPFASIPFPVQDAHMAVLAPDAAGDMGRTLRQAVWRAEPDLPIPLVRSMREWVDRSSGGSRFLSFMFSAFGAVALALAAAGLYSTLLYTVGMERRELGIRLALGAARTRIHVRVLARGLRMVVTGVVLGMAAAWGAGRLLQSQLFGVEAHDLAPLSAAAGVLLVTAAAACWLPARRAASTDPMETLRAE